MRRAIYSVVAVLASDGAGSPALAGMPSLGFSELAAMRLSGISFFLAVLLVSAWAIQFLWNRLAKDFVQLPRLGYLRACGLVMLWGLLFVVVLTMISGARELMTPGAWEKQGVTYRLRKSESPAEEPRGDEQSLSEIARRSAERRLRLAELRHQLDRFAQEHDGKYPDSPEASGIAPSYWQTADVSGLRFVYVPGRTTSDRDLPLAYEPELYDGDPLVLLVGGEIVALPRERIAASLAQVSP